MDRTTPTVGELRMALHELLCNAELRRNADRREWRCLVLEGPFGLACQATASRRPDVRRNPLINIEFVTIVLSRERNPPERK